MRRIDEAVWRWLEPDWDRLSADLQRALRLSMVSMVLSSVAFLLSVAMLVLT